MIFVLFFSLSGAKVQFIVIIHNLTRNKTKKNCFTTQNLFLGRQCGKKRSPLKTTKGIIYISLKLISQPVW